MAAASGAGTPSKQAGQSSYQAFLARLHHPDSAALLRSMKVFVRNALAATHLTIDDLAEATRAFFQQAEEMIAEHPQWAGCEPSELERANDGVEKFVMTKLHDRVFAAEAEEAAEDEQFLTWMKRLNFLRVEHLSISPGFAQLQPWQSAQQELAKISTYRTPRDKLVCILNCCKRINSALSMASGGGHGADEFFPVLIFVTLQAAPVGLHASLQYIARFRHPSKLVSEAAYYLTNLQSVVAFISNIQPEQLTIDPAEYEQGLAETHSALEQQEKEQRQRHEQRLAAEREVALAGGAVGSTREMESGGQLVPSAISNGVTHGEGGGVETPTPPARHRGSADGAADDLEPPTPHVDPATPGAHAQRPGRQQPMPSRVEHAASAPESQQPRVKRRAAPTSVAMTLSVEDGSGGDGDSCCPLVRVRLSVGSVHTLRRQRMEQALSAELGWCGPPPSLRFLETRSVVELTVGEVADLLEEFKWLSRWAKRFPPQHLS